MHILPWKDFSMENLGILGVSDRRKYVLFVKLLISICVVEIALITVDVILRATDNVIFFSTTLLLAVIYLCMIGLHGVFTSERLSMVLYGILTLYVIAYTVVVGYAMPNDSYKIFSGIHAIITAIFQLTVLVQGVILAFQVDFYLSVVLPWDAKSQEQCSPPLKAWRRYLAMIRFDTFFSLICAASCLVYHKAGWLMALFLTILSLVTIVWHFLIYQQSRRHWSLPIEIGILALCLGRAILQYYKVHRFYTYHDNAGDLNDSYWGIYISLFAIFVLGILSSLGVIITYYQYKRLWDVDFFRFFDDEHRREVKNVRLADIVAKDVGSHV